MGDTFPDRSEVRYVLFAPDSVDSQMSVERGKLNNLEDLMLKVSCEHFLTTPGKLTSPQTKSSFASKRRNVKWNH